MSDVKVLIFSGSARNHSYNQRLASVAAEAVREGGGTPRLINLGDFHLPIFDEDTEREEGHPQPVHELMQLFIEHHALLIASPEYNSSITPLLKNAIDWVSRPVEGEPPLRPYLNKVAGLVSASPGALGGLRGLVHVRSILQNIGVTVVPKQLAVPRAHEAFDEQGNLKDATQRMQVGEIADLVIKHANALN